MQDKVRKIIFHTRPWEVDLYVALEDYLANHTGMNLRFHYLTHNLEAEYLLQKKGKACLNITRALKKIPFPADWRNRLQDLEDSCSGPVRNFHQYLSAERFLQGKPRLHQFRQVYRTAMFFNAYFAQHKPFFMLSSGPDHLAFWLAMDLLRHHGGHPCGLVPSSWPPNKIILFRQVGQNYWGREIYEELLAKGLSQADREEARRCQESMRAGKEMPFYIRSDRYRFAPKRSFGSRLRGWGNALYWKAAERHAGGWYVQPIRVPVLQVFFEKLSVRLKAKFVNRYLIDEVDLQGPYVFFPLHLEPEATILVHSNPYDNQLEIIRMLSKSLPISWTLVVKDHPNMAGRRRLEFIRTVKQLPNVLFINPSEPSWRLFTKAQVVVTLTGTAGLESCLLGRPVLFFGEPAWGYAPTCRQVGDLKNLAETLVQTANAALSPEDDRVQAFLLSWARSNPEGNFDFFPWVPPVSQPDNVENLGQALIRLWDDITLGKLRLSDGNSQKLGES